MQNEASLVEAIRSAIHPHVYGTDTPAANLRLIIADREGVPWEVLDFPLDGDKGPTVPEQLTGVPDVWASPGYRAVRWFGRWYHFTPTQSAVVRVLWEARLRGRSSVPHAEIIAAVDCCPRLREVFRDDGKIHQAWGPMIVGKGTGAYLLNVDGAEGGR